MSFRLSKKSNETAPDRYGRAHFSLFGIGERIDPYSIVFAVYSKHTRYRSADKDEDIVDDVILAKILEDFMTIALI